MFPPHTQCSFVAAVDGAGKSSRLQCVRSFSTQYKPAGAHSLAVHGFCEAGSPTWQLGRGARTERERERDLGGHRKHRIERMRLAWSNLQW